MSDKIRIAIVAQRALPVISPKYRGNFGGLETSAWLTSKSLARKSSTEVSLIVRYPWPVAVADREGVQVIARWKPIETTRESLQGKIQITKQFPFIKFFTWAPSLLWKVPLLTLVRLFSANRDHELIYDCFYPKLQKDVIIVFGTNLVSAKVILALRETDTRTILSIQSNSDVDERFANDDGFVNDYGERSEVIRYVLSNVDKIVVQNVLQQRKLKQNFGRESTLLNNPFDLDAWDEQRLQNESPERRYVLWVGRPDRFHKRPHLLLEVAKSCPEIPFLMILNSGDFEIRREIEASKTENVEIIDRVPFSEMPARFEKAALFAFTGSEQHEGFPNVLLQAAASEKAIVSYDFVPQAIADSGGAIVAGSVEKMVKEIKRLYHHPSCAEGFGRRGRVYVEKNGDLDAYAEKLLDIIQE